MEALAAKPDAAAARGEHDARLDYEIVVIGAGFSGIGAAIKLQQARLDDFVILEQAADLGGTWRDNTYPGVAVDITSLTYSFSFAQNPGWSRLFAPGDEIRRYADRCADDYGLRDHMRFNTRVRQATFDEAENLWRIESSTGTITARYIITACGGLAQPKASDIDGLDRFEGKVMHTARWDHDYDVKGKRVAVIGTGASAVQVIPAIAPTVGRLHVFQRTPPWVLPKPDREIPRWMSRLFRAVPATQTVLRLLMSTCTELVLVAGLIYHRQLPIVVRRIEALCTRHLQRQVSDPGLRDKLTPRYAFGCKRPCLFSDYFPALTRDNVELVTQPIEHVTPAGIRTADGVTRAVDTLRSRRSRTTRFSAKSYGGGGTPCCSATGARQPTVTTSTATAMRRFCGRRRHSSVGGAAVTSISIITNTAEAASRTRRAATRPDYSSGYAGSVVSRVSSMGPPRVKW